MNLKERRDSALTQARQIVDGAKAADWDLNPGERQAFEAHLATADEMAGHLKTATTDHARLSRIGQLEAEPEIGQKGYLRLNPRAIAETVVAKARASSGPETKALLTAGTIIADVPVLVSPVAMGRPAVSLLDVVPSYVTGRDFSYLRQTTRTNLAAPVASGALKPTNTHGLIRVADHLRVIAHLSEGIDRFWIEDAADLAQFLASELDYGLRKALEAQILAGPGTEETFTGLANPSGILAQAFVTNQILTCRAALTAIETSSDAASGYFVLNPTDWAGIETSSLSSGAYVLADAGQAVPVESATRRLWGRPVYSTTGQPVGTGLFVQTTAAAAAVDGRGVVMETSPAVSDDFAKNLVRIRCEGRFALAVFDPGGIVKIDLTA